MSSPWLPRSSCCLPPSGSARSGDPQLRALGRRDALRRARPLGQPRPAPEPPGRAVLPAPAGRVPSRGDRDQAPRPHRRQHGAWCSSCAGSPSPSGQSRSLWRSCSYARPPGQHSPGPPRPFSPSNHSSFATPAASSSKPPPWPWPWPECSSWWSSCSRGRDRPRLRALVVGGLLLGFGVLTKDVIALYAWPRFCSRRCGGTPCTAEPSPSSWWRLCCPRAVPDRAAGDRALGRLVGPEGGRFARVFGAVQDAGFNAPGSPSLVGRLIDQVGQSGPARAACWHARSPDCSPAGAPARSDGWSDWRRCAWRVRCLQRRVRHVRGAVRTTQ